MANTARILEHNGKRQTMAEWAMDIGMTTVGLYHRVKRHGVERALTLPPTLRIVKSAAANIDATLPFEKDRRCVDFVRENPEGATLEAIGDEFGVSREAIRLVEEAALEKMKIGQALVDLVGQESAERILVRLRGKSPMHFRACLSRIRNKLTVRTA